MWIPLTLLAMLLKLMTESLTPVLRKPTGTIQIGNRFSLTERKLLNTLIWHSQENERVTGSERTLSIAEVFHVIGWTKSKNKDDLKQAVRKLAGTTVEWNEFSHDQTQSWTVCTFLSSGKITKNELKYRLNPEIVNQINRPTLYAKMQLLIQGQFNRRHSLILYEFFLDFITRQHEKPPVLEGVELSLLFKLLGLQNSSYSAKGNYRFFNRDILKPSLQEINEYSDLDVSAKPHRYKRAIHTLDFSVKRKKSFQLTFDLVDKCEEEESLKQQLVDLGVGDKQAEQLCENYSGERIAANLVYYEAQIKSGIRVTNVGAWLKCAVEEDYRKNTKNVSVTKSKRECVKEEQELLEMQWAKFKENTVREKYMKKPKAWQDKEIAAFEKSDKLNNALFRKKYVKEGIKNPIVAALFYQGLHATLLTKPHETDLKAYKLWHDRRGARRNENLSIQRLTTSVQDEPEPTIRNTP